MIVTPRSEPLGGSYKTKVGKTFGNLTVISYAGENERGKTVYKCKCVCGKILLKNTGNLRAGIKSSCGCQMNQSLRTPLEEMKNRVTSKTRYAVVSSSELWSSTWVLSCPDHGEFKIRYSSVQTGKSFCPNCRSFGFNPTKAATFYINSIKDKTGSTVAYKYGITSQVISRRLRQIEKDSDLFVVNEFNIGLLGEDAQLLEKYFKKNIPSNYLSKDILPNGFTETVSPYQIINIVKIIQLIKKD